MKSELEAYIFNDSELECFIVPSSWLECYIFNDSELEQFLA